MKAEINVVPFVRLSVNRLFHRLFPLIIAVIAVIICAAGPAAAGRSVTLMWDASIDAPYLASYNVYYYPTSGQPDSLTAAGYALSYTLSGGDPISLNPLTDPKAITIDKSNTQITLQLPSSTNYYFIVTAVDTRGLESVPTAEVSSEGSGEETEEETEGATGVIAINNGAGITNNPLVTLSISAAGATEMQFSNDGSSWSDAESVAATKQWQLAEGDGQKTVYAKFKDASGNWSSASSASITLDTTPPAVEIGEPSVTVTISGPVTYMVTYTDASSMTLTSADVTLIKSGTATGSVSVSGAGEMSQNVTIYGISGNGSLGIAIAAGTASDAAGNMAEATGTSATFAVGDQDTPVYISSKVTSGNIPGLSVVVVDSSSVVVDVCDVADDGTWASQLLPAGQYSWYLIYGSLVSTKNATSFNTSSLKSIGGKITGLPTGGGAVSVRSVTANLQKTISVAADGTYTVSYLIPASDYQVAVVAENLPVTYYNGKTDISEANYVNVSTANATTINFTLAVPDSHITGTITDAAGGVAGLSVYAYETGTAATTYTTTLSNGSYDLQVKTGTYLVFVIKNNGKIFYFHKEDGTPTQNETYAVTRTISASNQTVGNTNINITEGTQVLKGKVTYTSASGNPVSNALVVASTQMEQSLAITDVSGNYTISGLQTGTTYTVSMKTLSGNYPIQTASIVAGTDTTKNFIIGIGAVLSGTVTSKADPTKKISGAAVYITDQTTNALVGGRIYYSGADGTYSIYDNQSGNYALEVYHPSYRGYSADISIGSANVVHDVSMETGASFKGTIRDANGNALSGATVTATRADSASIYTTTNSTGAYTIYGLDATKNDYTVTVQKNGYDRQILTDLQPASGGTTVDVTLSVQTFTYHVSGVVKTSDAAPLADATVLVSSKSLNFHASTTTETDGSYTITGLVNTGNYTITVLPSGNLPLQSTAFTVNSANVNLNLTVALGNQVSGYIFGSPALPAGQNVYVYLYQGTQYIGYAKTTTGIFSFQGLNAASNYKILAQSDGYANQWYTGKNDMASANTIASGNVSVSLTLAAAQ